MPDNITIRLVNLPTRVRGLTVTDVDGHFDVYINARLSRNMQKQTYRHEMRHIRRNDFYNGKPISTIEEN